MKMGAVGTLIALGILTLIVVLAYFAVVYLVYGPEMAAVAGVSMIAGAVIVSMSHA